jgi:hypothetical protein
MDKSERWYTRRNGVVRGPYPAGQISRYILLGRIRENDELSLDQHSWEEVSQCQALIPEVMKLPPTEENIKRLMMARMHEDERRSGDRRDNEPDPPAHIKERRTGEERRQVEPELLVRHRKLKQSITQSVSKVTGSYKTPLLMIAVVLSGFLLSTLINPQTDQNERPSDCLAPAEVGVNWDNCNLSGANIEGAVLNDAMIRFARLDGSVLTNAQLINVRFDYTSLANSDLSETDLTNAVLVGANLNAANLRNAKLSKANLAYADLSGALIEGADLTGAVLGNAIWVDQRKCAPSSIGRCER